jgi:hypothetical protein
MNEKLGVFVCGVQKGGTASLYEDLYGHPQLSAPTREEIHFFDDEAIDWASPDYAQLHAYFGRTDASRIRFDVTPIYCYWPPSMGRIHAYNASAKLVFLFRDPFERAWSHWCMEYARGQETLPFSEAIRAGRDRMNGRPELGPERRTYSYIERGLYADQVERARIFFPREQLLFLRSEDLRDDRTATLARIATFLGIARFPATTERHGDARAEPSCTMKPPDADRMFIGTLVRDDLRRFATLTDLDISAWPSAAAE